MKKAKRYKDRGQGRNGQPTPGVFVYVIPPTKTHSVFLLHGVWG